MALVDNAWYVNFGDGSTTGYFAVGAWVLTTTKVCGNLIRATAPAVGSERVHVCISSTAGTGATGATEPTWVTTRGGKTTDGTLVWQEATGIAALNGDLSTNTPTWTIVKNTAVTLGQVIQNVAGTLVLICTTAGTAGNGAEPSWAAFTNAGATTADNTVTWTTLGASFAAWAAPHARLGNALASTWVQAGNKVFVGDNHAETQAATNTLNQVGTTANPIFVYCVDRTVAVPPGTGNLKTTATISTTGNNGFNIGGGNGCGQYFYGITFNCGSGANAATFGIAGSGVGPYWLAFDSCSLALAETGAGAMNFGKDTYSCKIRLINTTLSFGGTGQMVIVGAADFGWANTASALLGAAVPTTLFSGAINSRSGTMVCQGVDFSAAGAGKTIVGSSSNCNLHATLIDCKLGASVTVAATPASPGITTDVIRCDSGATNYFDSRYWYEGTQIVETTIVRTGGATDGTTVESWKLVATANSKWLLPFESQPITIWNDATSAITTLTLYGTTTGGGVPNNDDIWVEVEYLGSSATPQGSFITTTKANNLAASVTTNNSSDASTWGGGGAGNGFKMVVPSFTPGMKGPLNIIIHVAKASATYYIDPRPVVT